MRFGQHRPRRADLLGQPAAHLAQTVDALVGLGDPPVRLLGRRRHAAPRFVGGLREPGVRLGDRVLTALVRFRDRLALTAFDVRLRGLLLFEDLRADVGGVLRRLLDAAGGLGLARRLLLGQHAHRLGAARGHRDLEVFFDLRAAVRRLGVELRALGFGLVGDLLGLRAGVLEHLAVLRLHLLAAQVELGEQLLVAGAHGTRVRLGLRPDVPGLGFGASARVGGFVLCEAQHPLKTLREAFDARRRLGEPVDLPAQVRDLAARDLQLPRQVAGLRDGGVPIGREHLQVGVQPFEVLVDLRSAVSPLRHVEAGSQRHKLPFIAKAHAPTVVAGGSRKGEHPCGAPNVPRDAAKGTGRIRPCSGRIRRRERPPPASSSGTVIRRRGTR